MRFNSNSILLNDGITVNVTINLPSILENVDISNAKWERAVVKFNQLLNKRSSVTEQIGIIPVDVLYLGDKKTMSLAIKPENADDIMATWFSIKGQVIFNNSHENEVDELLISDIIYKDSTGIVRGILNKT